MVDFVTPLTNPIDATHEARLSSNNETKSDDHHGESLASSLLTNNRTVNYNAEEHVKILNSFVKCNAAFKEKNPRADDKVHAGEKDPIWNEIKEDIKSFRSSKVIQDHFKDMRTAFMKARSNHILKYSVHFSDQEKAVWYQGITLLMRSNSKLYFSSCWWDETVIKLMHSIITDYETKKGTGNKVQDANGISELRAVYANKFEAEQEIKRKRFEDMRSEELEEKILNRKHKHDLSMNINKIAESISIIAASNNDQSSTTSSTTAVSDIEARVSGLESSFNDFKSEMKVAQDEMKNTQNEMFSFLRQKFA